MPASDTGTAAPAPPAAQAAPAALLALQERIGHRFTHPALLLRALTHRSFAAEHNERLELLGDSVLSLAVTTLLYQHLDSHNEGELSRTRANLVKQDTLHRLALALGLPELLRLGEGEARSGGRQRASILADALEALLGAVYLDAGFAAAEALVRRLYAGIDLRPGQGAHGKDAKTALQEWLQGRKMQLPLYTVAATRGQAHLQTFEVQCQINETGQSARGLGSSRRAAEQAAAAQLLQQLQNTRP
ncbi:ribonuclease III [Serpentinimonas maccroryi]|uniref:ribonuclease III n=1 Tax=Serpentinimonas maccroryi TaxID=1458426 RepID=UPI0020333A7D|nr:ribonuclease III [Serpentinimonas maccroryi]MCM2479855.1 ribonuclease III [Serpentinimonas maccroryi]